MAESIGGPIHVVLCKWMGRQVNAQLVGTRGWQAVGKHAAQQGSSIASTLVSKDCKHAAPCPGSPSCVSWVTFSQKRYLREQKATVGWHASTVHPP